MDYHTFLICVKTSNLERRYGPFIEEQCQGYMNYLKRTVYKDLENIMTIERLHTPVIVLAA